MLGETSAKFIPRHIFSNHWSSDSSLENWKIFTVRNIENPIFCKIHSHNSVALIYLAFLPWQQQSTCRLNSHPLRLDRHLVGIHLPFCAKIFAAKQTVLNKDNQFLRNVTTNMSSVLKYTSKSRFLPWNSTIFEFALVTGCRLLVYLLLWFWAHNPLTGGQKCFLNSTSCNRTWWKRWNTENVRLRQTFYLCLGAYRQ